MGYAPQQQFDIQSPIYTQNMAPIQSIPQQIMASPQAHSGITGIMNQMPIATTPSAVVDSETISIELGTHPDIAQLEGDFRVKFMTSHPKDLSEEVIQTIANNDKLSKVIHLPIQSGSNEILKSMNRKYTREHYLSLIDMIRKYIPNAYISTDIIVGFPGETEDDFMDTYHLIKEVKYDGVFAFMFSRRSGTVADKMENQIDEKIKKDRIHRLLELSKSITKEKNKNCIGQIFNVISINESTNGFETMTDSGKTIFVSEPLEKNKFYKVKVTKFTNNKLFGELV